MYKIKVNGEFDFTAERAGGQVTINDLKVDADIHPVSRSHYHIIHQLKSYNAEVISFSDAEKTAEIKVNNNIYQVSVKDKLDLLLDQLGLSNLNSVKISNLKAPMPGLVLKVFVNEGDEVKKGENLFILEAMKMENIIKAPADLSIKSVKLTAGDKVEKGQVLLIFN